MTQNKSLSRFFTRSINLKVKKVFDNFTRRSEYTFRGNIFAYPNICGDRDQTPTNCRCYSAKQNGLSSTYSVDDELVDYWSQNMTDGDHGYQGGNVGNGNRDRRVRRHQLHDTRRVPAYDRSDAQAHN